MPSSTRGWNRYGLKRRRTGRYRGEMNKNTRSRSTRNSGQLWQQRNEARSGREETLDGRRGAQVIPLGNDARLSQPAHDDSYQ